MEETRRRALPGAERMVTGNFLRLGAGELAARIISFLVLIYLARVLGADLYGLVGFAYTVILYFVTVTDFGIETLGPREVVARRDDAGRLASAVLTARVALGAALAAGVALFSALFVSQPDRGVLGVYCLILLAAGGSSRWVHLGLEQTGAVARARIAGETLRAVATLALVRSPADLLLVPLLHVLGEALTTTLLAVSLRAAGIRLRPSWDPEVALPVLRTGWPIALNVTLGMVLYNSDVLLLRGFRPSAEVGFYLAAYTLITLLGNLATSYSASLLPTLSRLGGTSENGVRLYRAVLLQVAAGALPIAAGGFVLAPLIVGVVFGGSYQPAAGVLQILILTVPLMFIRMVQHAALIARGRQDRVMWATAIAAAVNIGTNLVIIPRYGMVGAACTTLLCEGLRTALIQHFVLREGYGTAVVRAVRRPALAALAMAGLLLALPLSSLWLGLLLGGTAYLLALTVCRGLQLVPGRFPALRA